MSIEMNNHKRDNQQRALKFYLIANLLIMLGMLLAPVSYAAKNSSKATLHFKGTDIHEVIEAVSGVTGKNFVIDPRVKGKVTIISSKSMKARDIFEVFMSVLQVHGYAVVPSGKVYQIVPIANAKQGPLVTQTNGKTRDSSDFITRVFHIDHVPAAQLVPILRPLLPQHAHLAAYQPTNSLILSDRSDNILRLEKIIRSIDQPSRAEVEVVSLKNASATEVVRILSSMENKAASAGQVKAAGPSFIADERSNSLILAGDTAWRSRIRSLIAQLDEPLGIETGNTQVVYLRYAKSEDLAKVLTGVSKAENKAKGKGGGKGVASQDSVSIQADAGTNALVITAPPEQLRTLKSVVAKLDVPRAQVMVEAIIAEVSDDRVRELGVQWLFDGVTNGTNSPTGAINFPSSGNSIVDLAAGIAAGTGISVNGAALAFGSVGGGSRDMAGVLQALSGDTGVNVLSTPSIVTLDNEEAEITVGEERPFVTGSYSNTGGGSTPTNPFTTINREQVGLTLKVTPQINEGSAIRLAIEQEVSSVIPGSEGDFGPATTNRSLKTNVMVDDGKMLVLGGLVDEQVQEVEQGVPGLRDIPVLGWLFRYHKSVKVKRNLMIFLKPTIIRDTNQGTLLSSEKYNYIRVQQLAAKEEMRSFLAEEETPVLQEFDKYLDLPPTFEEYMSTHPDNSAVTEAVNE
ncbi:MAG: type II secretion system secretin GspD [Gammaproteobacteria bacterium]|nr:type II secretion system secretin GspD [Gammaproteobacteria bacterium]